MLDAFLVALAPIADDAVAGGRAHEKDARAAGVRRITPRRKSLEIVAVNAAIIAVEEFDARQAGAGRSAAAGERVVRDFAVVAPADDDSPAASGRRVAADAGRRRAIDIDNRHLARAGQRVKALAARHFADARAIAQVYEVICRGGERELTGVELHRSQRTGGDQTAPVVNAKMNGLELMIVAGAIHYR